MQGPDSKQALQAQQQRDLLKAQQKFIHRSDPSRKFETYPWNNYDYQYTDYVKSKFTPEQMGFSDAPCISTLVGDIFSIKDFLEKGFVTGAIPSADSNAADPDMPPGTSPGIYDLKKKYDDFGEPYPGFKAEYPEYFPKMVDGKYASSYFIKSGTCPVASIADEKTCTDKGYTWIANKVALEPKTQKFYPDQTPAPDPVPGTTGGPPPPPDSHCFKPRYSYVNNVSGDISGAFEGIIPTLTKEMMSLNPVSFMGILMSGASPFGDFQQLPCKEGFDDMNSYLTGREREGGWSCVSLIIFLAITTFIVYQLVKSR